MTRVSLIVADSLFWPFIQLTVSAVFVRLPRRLFGQNNMLTRQWSLEHSIRFYRTIFVPRWKKLLPDGAPWVGGTAKRVSAFSQADVSLYLCETRRAEMAHWLQLAFASICWLWNPVWAALVMTAYAVLTNIPCIFAQRYNRALLEWRKGQGRQS